MRVESVLLRPKACPNFERTVVIVNAKRGNTRFELLTWDLSTGTVDCSRETISQDY